MPSSRNVCHSTRVERYARTRLRAPLESGSSTVRASPGASCPTEPSTTVTTRRALPFPGETGAAVRTRTVPVHATSPWTQRTFTRAVSCRVTMISPSTATAPGDG